MREELRRFLENVKQGCMWTHRIPYGVVCWWGYSVAMRKECVMYCGPLGDCEVLEMYYLPRLGLPCAYKWPAPEHAVGLEDLK